jgi:hypothetical protein
MNYPALEALADQLKSLLGLVAVETSVQVERGRGIEPSLVLVSVLFDTKQKSQHVEQLAKALSVDGWKYKRRVTTSCRDGRLWRINLRLEYIPMIGKPLAIRLAEEGRGGQEENPAYTIDQSRQR